MSLSIFAVVALAIVGATISEIAKAFAKRRGSPEDLTAIRQQVAQQAEALEAAHAGLQEQAGQIAELQERLDFAERLLTQVRERAPLNPGQPPGGTRLG